MRRNADNPRGSDHDSPFRKDDKTTVVASHSWPQLILYCHSRRNINLPKMGKSCSRHFAAGGYTIKTRLLVNYCKFCSIYNDVFHSFAFEEHGVYIHTIGTCRKNTICKDIP